MAAAVLRRSVATAGLAVLATMASPLVGTALAATFTGTISSDPAADSNGVVAANRPTFSANFSDDLAPSSTITVKQGTDTVACPQTIDSNVVSCTPSADLADGKDYVVTAHGVKATDHSVVADAPAVTYTIEYPTYDSGQSIPLPGGTLIGGHEPITAGFDEPVAGNTDTYAADGAVKVYELITDGSVAGCTAATPCRGNQLPGSISFPKTGVPAAPGSTVVFSPADTLVPGHYEAAFQVDGVDANGADNPKAHTTADYYFWVNSVAPANLTSDGAAPNWVNNQNNTAVPFHGTAAPGETVTVTVQDANDDPTGVFWPASSVVVPDCHPTDLATGCPWSTTVDVSTLTNGSPVTDDTYAWDAEGFDGNTSGGSAIHTTDVNAPAAQDIRIDTTAPNTPTVGSTTVTQTSNPDHTTINLHLTPGTDQFSGTPDTDVVGYDVTATDASGNHSTQRVGATQPQQFDATSLDDGTLSLTAVAVDGAGNASSATNAFKVTKNAGLKQDFANSSLVTPAKTVTFPDAVTQPVQPPTKLVISFTQPVKLSYVDQTTVPNATTHGTTVCVASANGNCIVFANSAVLSNGDKTMTVTVPTKVVDGPYTIKVSTYSKNLCPDKTVQNTQNGTWSCQGYHQLITAPGSATPFTFHVDGTAPTAPTISMPSKITPATVHAVTISGTAEPSSTVTLTIKSSSGGATFLAGHGAPITADSATGAWQTVEDLSTVRDGTLTVTAKDADAAGNVGSYTLAPAPVLAAHASKLTESVTGTVVTYGKGVLLSGKLVDQAGAAISGATISVKPRFVNGSYGTAQTTTTTSTGHWQLTEFPAHNATWYATYAGHTTSPVHDAVTVSTARTLVRAAIAFTSPRNNATVGSPVVLKGKVSPNQRGKTVSIYRHTSRGNTLLGKVKLSRTSTWSFKLTMPKGTVKVFAVIANTTGNLGNRTGYLTITH